ncbi:SDR family NAD(P)-dependent oxidoreductase [Rhodococcus sp. OK302]|uniref:SDR family NAD(P)-dependent oxidoreductase n=1 Tax=Rhodococcus sp. OK302 TaxID=1882769 RepID=UPI0020CF23E8|nr:SDR family oxidoreductase [Rhodococcus sp. OK302]
MAGVRRRDAELRRRTPPRSAQEFRTPEYSSEQKVSGGNRQLNWVVITIGSITVDKGAGAYGAAKAAVATWNIDLAAELGPEGITANIVSPGYIGDTEFFRDILTDERRDAMIESTSTKRAGTPEDIAAAVFFLASSGARQITGQVLAVNGGERTSR